jgi:rhodanese-related sulfurtransferase
MMAAEALLAWECTGMHVAKRSGKCVQWAIHAQLGAMTFSFIYRKHLMKKITSNLFLASLVAVAASSTGAAFAQTGPAAAPATPAPARAVQEWNYKTPQLHRADVDVLLVSPKDVVILDVRRPDELSKNGAFRAYVNIQIADLEKSLDFIPKDRTIITVSNRAHRAGDAGDLLLKKGYKVAGAIGTLDYKEQGGTLAHVVAPPPRTAANSAAIPATSATAAK